MTKAKSKTKEKVKTKEEEISKSEVNTDTSDVKEEVPKEVVSSVMLSWEDGGEVNGFSPNRWLTTIEEAHSTSRCEEAKYIFKTEDQAKSAIALAMLTQQIADVNEEWTPDWTKQDTFCIKLNLDDEPYVFDKPYSQAFLAFRTKDQADNFLEANKSLILKAKAFI